MQGFIKASILNKSLINIENIQCIEHYDDCIHVSLNNGTNYTIFIANNDLEHHHIFLDRMIDRIFLVLSGCKYGNVFIDIEAIKNDVIRELQLEALNGNRKIFTI